MLLALTTLSASHSARRESTLTERSWDVDDPLTSLDEAEEPMDPYGPPIQHSEWLREHAAPELEFIHIPKNAGTSFEAAGLEMGFHWGYEKFKQVEPCASDQNFGCQDKLLSCNMQHVPRGVLRTEEHGSVLLGPDPFAGSDTFCVVRHPFDRAVSQYLYHSLMAPGSGCREHWEDPADCPKAVFNRVCKPAKLNAYINERLNAANGRFVGALSQIRSIEGPVGEALKGTSQGVGEDCHWLPQWMYVGYGNKRLCDNVLRLESLEQDLGELVAQYPHNRELARLPKVLAKQRDTMATRTPSACPLTADDLDDRSRQQLGDVYWRDFWRFNYTWKTTDGAFGWVSGPGWRPPSDIEWEAEMMSTQEAE